MRQFCIYRVIGTACRKWTSYLLESRLNGMIALSIARGHQQNPLRKRPCRPYWFRKFFRPFFLLLIRMILQQFSACDQYGPSFTGKFRSPNHASSFSMWLIARVILVVSWAFQNCVSSSKSVTDRAVLFQWVFLWDRVFGKRFACRSWALKK
jgi:hypothetical protein